MMVANTVSMEEAVQQQQGDAVLNVEGQLPALTVVKCKIISLDCIKLGKSMPKIV